MGSHTIWYVQVYTALGSKINVEFTKHLTPEGYKHNVTLTTRNYDCYMTINIQSVCLRDQALSIID